MSEKQDERLTANFGKYSISYYPAEDGRGECLYISFNDDDGLYIYSNGTLGGIIDGRRGWECKSMDTIIKALAVQRAVALLNSVK